MNERLQKMYEQAVRESYDFHTNKQPVMPKDVERFAKMIIGKCCDMMIQLETQYPANLTVREIKKHFGVEE